MAALIPNIGHTLLSILHKVLVIWKRSFLRLGKMFPAALRAILQLLLFCLFLYMYGLPAWEKLNQQSTIVIMTRENTKGIQAPSISIASINKATGFGWENITQQTKYMRILLCISAKTTHLLRHVWPQRHTSGTNSLMIHCSDSRISYTYSTTKMFGSQTSHMPVMEGCLHFTQTWGLDLSPGKNKS